MQDLCLQVDRMEDLFSIIEGLEKEEQSLKQRYLENKQKQLQEEAEQEVCKPGGSLIAHPTVGTHTDNIAALLSVQDMATLQIDRLMGSMREPSVFVKDSPITLGMLSLI